MTSITEAVFKGRSRRGTPTPPEALRRSTAPLTTQFMARKAIEAVLAGGYTKCEDKTPQQPLPPAPPQTESRGYGRALTMWIAIFGVAGLLGIATSHLPGHAVHAKQAPPVEAAAVFAEPAAPPAPAPVRPVAVAGVTARPARPVAPPAARPPALQVPVLRAQLRPVSKRPVMIADSEAVGGVAPVADEAPLAARHAPSGNANAPALEEVLYEGEPAQSARAVAPRAAGSAASGSVRRAADDDGAQSESKPAGRLKVEGIFWDKVRPMAIIGGNIVESGSPVGRYTVTEIQQDRVILSGGGLTFELRP